MARAHEPLRAVPIVLCSADLRELRQRADEMSALADVHILEKPFTVAQADELVRNLLGRRPASETRAPEA